MDRSGAGALGGQFNANLDAAAKTQGQANENSQSFVAEGRAIGEEASALNTDVDMQHQALTEAFGDNGNYSSGMNKLDRFLMVAGDKGKALEENTSDVSNRGKALTASVGDVDASDEKSAFQNRINTKSIDSQMENMKGKEMAGVEEKRKYEDYKKNYDDVLYGKLPLDHPTIQRLSKNPKFAAKYKYNDPQDFNPDDSVFASTGGFAGNNPRRKETMPDDKYKWKER